MITPAPRKPRPVDYLAPGALAGLGALFLLVCVASLVGPTPGAGPWWIYLVLLVPAAVMLGLGVALFLDPRPLGARQALAAAGLLWLLVLVGGLVAEVTDVGPGGEAAILTALAGVLALALLGLAATTPAVAVGPLPGPLGRVAAVVVFVAAITAAGVTLVVVVSVATAIAEAVATGTVPGHVPWLAFGAIILLPVVSFAIATFLTRRAAGGTFYAQAAANRRNSLLLLVTLVGVVAATAEIVAAAVTFSPLPALWAAGIAALVGLGAAAGAHRFGADVILQAAGVRPADERRDETLRNVVREISLAAGIPEPQVYVIEDGSMNAFATGRDAGHASIAVTRGLLDGMDREQLQGVVAHELAHVRNLDTRYALYVAVLVGLVALVTDGFLRTVVEGWRNGAFIWTGGDGDDIRAAIAGFLMGLAVGLFLLLVAAALRVVAPLFSMLVQAAVSREREFLADATSVELTRNPDGLQRALAAIAADRDELEAANRGTQHLWFRNPVKAGSDRRAGLLSTHPSLGARIERLARLSGAPVPAAALAAGLGEET